MKALIITLGILSAAAAYPQDNLLVKDGLICNKDGSLYNGEIVTSSKNGIKESEVEIVNGRQSGSATYFYASGTIMETGVFYNGLKHGPWVHYNGQGRKISYGNFVSGKKDGKWIIWDDKGVKRCEMNYTEGEKSGTWYLWDEHGSLIKTTQYSNS